MARSTAQPARRGTTSSLVALWLLASTAAAQQQQSATCVYIGGSTVCPAYNTSYISTDSTLVGYLCVVYRPPKQQCPLLTPPSPFLANVTDTASFDNNLRTYATNGYVTSKYQNTFGCTNINPSNTTDIYARYTISFICNSIVQNSLDPCNVSQSAYPPICASSCAYFAQSEAEIVGSSQLCSTTNPNAPDLLRADFTNCALPTASISGSCILASDNEPDNCGFLDNLSGLCNYCAASTVNNTDSCCVTAQTESRCTNVRLPIYGSSQPGVTAPLPSATGNSTAPPAPAASNNSGLSGGQIAGIVVGSVIGGVALLCLLVFGCFMARKRSSSGEKATFLNQPTPPRSGGTATSRRSGPESKFEPVPNARVTRMTALEGPAHDSPESNGNRAAGGGGGATTGLDGAFAGAAGVMGAAGLASIPKREKSGVQTPPLDSREVPSSTDPSPQETDSSPEGGNMRSEQMDAFKDYYSQDDIHPGDLVSTLWAYQPRAGDEFELERGDMLKIVGIWDDGWATGVRINGRAEDWDPERNFTRDSGFSNNESTGDSPPTNGNVKAFPHWSKTVDGEEREEGGDSPPDNGPDEAQE